jgi:uncharacterized protein (DUF3820 family)
MPGCVLGCGASLEGLRMKPEDLMKLVNTPMPFGKHKGMLIADLPGNYLNWFAREGFPKGEVGQLLRLMQEIDHNGLSDLLKPLRNNQVCGFSSDFSLGPCPESRS